MGRKNEVDMKKKYLYSLLCVMFFVLPGCATLQRSISEKKYNINDIRNFVKIGTGITLSEGRIPKIEAVKIEQYLIQLKNQVVNVEVVDFNQFRASIQTLPQQYQFIGATIIDIIERFIRTQVENFVDRHDYTILLISAGLEGALSATQNYINQLS